MTLPVCLAFAGAALAMGQALAVALQRRCTLTPWAFAGGMLGLAVEAAFLGTALDASEPAEIVRWHSARLIAEAALVAPWLAFTRTYAQGKRTSIAPAERYAAVALALVPLVVAIVFRDRLIGAINPTGTGTDGTFALRAPALVVHLALLVSSLAMIAHLERTYRSAVGTTLWRIKFMLLGVALLFAVRIVASSHALLFRVINANIEILSGAGLLTGSLVIMRSLFRSGHFEVHVYPSTSLLRGSVTLVFAGAYLLLVGALGKMAWLHLPGEFALTILLALLGLVGLAGALQSDRVQVHIRRFVSLHLQRPYYDYRSTWRAFNEAVASRLDPDDAARAVVRLVADLFEAKSVSLWLTRDDGTKIYCASSSSLDEGIDRPFAPTEMEAATVLQQFSKHPYPVMFEKRCEHWAGTLRELHPKLFLKGGDRIAAPLARGRTVLGFLVLGDRLGIRPFGEQDFEMLRCVADHTASNLLGIRRTQHSLQNRELAAFQSMAAFFVHDLKNAASTLTLMLPNSAVHWNDPRFREDTLRGIKKTAGHINALIERLGHLRREMTIQPGPAELSAVVSRALENLPPCSHFTMETSFETMAPVLLDEAQFSSAVINLMLNARDAMPANREPDEGRVRVSTHAEVDRAVLTIADNGCGMSEEFIARSLFKPFQTTKKSGLGIGMFQTKMIIERHGGSIAVESVLGAGTTFKVSIPFATTSLDHVTSAALVGALPPQ